MFNSKIEIVIVLILVAVIATGIVLYVRRKSPTPVLSVSMNANTLTGTANPLTDYIPTSIYQTIPNIPTTNAGFTFPNASLQGAQEQTNPWALAYQVNYFIVVRNSSGDLINMSYPSINCTSCNANPILFSTPCSQTVNGCVVYSLANTGNYTTSAGEVAPDYVIGTGCSMGDSVTSSGKAPQCPSTTYPSGPPFNNVIDYPSGQDATNLQAMMSTGYGSNITWTNVSPDNTVEVWRSFNTVQQGILIVTIPVKIATVSGSPSVYTDSDYTTV